MLALGIMTTPSALAAGNSVTSPRTGSGHMARPDGTFRSFSFAAYESSDGRVTGQMQLNSRGFDVFVHIAKPDKRSHPDLRPAEQPSGPDPGRPAGQRSGSQLSRNTAFPPFLRGASHRRGASEHASPVSCNQSVKQTPTSAPSDVRRRHRPLPICWDYLCRKALTPGTFGHCDAGTRAANL